MTTVIPNHPIHPDFHERISVKVEGQLPGFVKHDHELFVSFLEAYYEYMEQVGKPYEVIGNLNNYANIDKTVDEFLQYFKKQFGDDIPESIFANSNKPFILKHLRDFYRTKGSEKSFEFLFRLLYQEEITITYPGKDILRTSDGKYDTSYVIRTIDMSENIFSMEGKRITGQTSGAKATVESIIVEILGSACITSLFLSEVLGEFQTNELISDGTHSFSIGNMIIDSEVTNSGSLYSVDDIIPLMGVAKNSGALIRVREITSGSLTTTTINNAGSGYKVGDKLTINNTNKLSLDGRPASLIVQDVDVNGSITKLWLENKGSGYIALPTIDGGGSGTDADIVFNLEGTGIGGIKKLEIINSGFGYNNIPTLDFSGQGDGTATATLSIGGFDTTPKTRFINSDGFLSANKYIQDSNFYQLFSYEIESSQNIIQWRDIVKRLIHPAGLALFGKVQYTSRFAAPLSITSIVPDTLDRYTIVFHDGTLTPPYILDLNIETCDDAQDIRVFHPTDNYGGFILDDDFEDYQPSPDTLSTAFSVDEDYQPSPETLSTVFSSEENYGQLIEPAATTQSANIGCPGDIDFPFTVGICSPTDFGLITDSDINGGGADLQPEDYGEVRDPNFYFQPTKCQTYEIDLGIENLLENYGYDDYLYTYISEGSHTGRSDTVEDYGSTIEASTDKEDYGKVNWFNTYFGTQKKLGPILRTQDTTKFYSSYRTTENIGTIQRIFVFDGADGHKIAPTVTVEAPVNGGTTATAMAYFKNPLIPDLQVGQGDDTTTPIILTQEVNDVSHITVSLNGLIQVPNVDYTVSGTTITFDEAVSTDESIMIYYLNYNDEYSLQTGQGDDTTTPVILTQVVNNAEDIIVSLNGITQIPTTDYTVSGTTITFDESVSTDESIVIQYLGDGWTTIQQGQGDDTTIPIVLSQVVTGNANSSESKKEHVIITLNGIRQIPINDYTIDGTTLTFNEVVSSDDNILVYYLDENMRPSSEELDYIAGIKVMNPGDGYTYEEIPNVTVAPSESGQTAIASATIVRGPHYSPISIRQNEKAADFLILRGNKTKRCVEPIITQYKLISDPNNAGSFYETTPPITDRLQGI